MRLLLVIAVVVVLAAPWLVQLVLLLSTMYVRLLLVRLLKPVGTCRIRSLPARWARRAKHTSTYRYSTTAVSSEHMFSRSDVALEVYVRVPTAGIGRLGPLVSNSVRNFTYLFSCFFFLLAFLDCLIFLFLFSKRGLLWKRSWFLAVTVKCPHLRKRFLCFFPFSCLFFQEKEENQGGKVLR